MRFCHFEENEQLTDLLGHLLLQPFHEMMKKL